jgi:hypothetical protein
VKKIQTLFVRNFDNDPRYVTRDVTPGCEWVLKGEGTPTRKYDGTCVMFDGTDWWARREVKKGKRSPAGFVEVEYDSETGKTVGWEPMAQSAFARWHAAAVSEAMEENGPGPWPVGTYELLGPKVNGNPEGFETHFLLLHVAAETLDSPRDFDGLAAWLHAHPYEGIVWHDGPEGAMAKIKRRDFKAP